MGMEGQQAPTQEELLKANLIFEKIRATNRSAKFLQRNLRRSLQLHQEELEREETGFAISTLGSEHLARKLFQKLDIQAISMHQSQKEVHILIKSMQPSSKNGQQRTTEVPPIKRKQLFSASVYVTTKIWSKEETRIVYQSDDSEATLKGVQTDCEKRFELDTKRIKISPDKLNLASPAEDNSSWPRGIGEKYDLDINIGFKTISQATDVISVMDWPRPRELVSSRWTASYSNFLQYPYPKDGIESVLTSKVDGNKKALQWNLCIALEYTAPMDSIFARSKRKLESNALDQTLGLPTPSEAQRSFEVTYLILGREVKYKDLSCTYCDTHRRSRFQKVDDLLMHFRTDHLYWTNRVIEQKTTSEGKQIIRIEGSAAEYKPSHRASQRVSDPRDISLVAPNRPFDQRAYLNGDESWQREALGEKIRNAHRAKEESSALRRGYSDEAMPTVQRRRRLYRVPKAPPGVTFFRALDKRPLEEGEEISESDDEIDMDWLRLKTTAMIMHDPKMPEGTKQFLKVYNEYIQDQRLQSDRHFVGALIRFSREHKAWLAEDEGLTVQFMKRLAELLDDHIITEEVHNECVRIVSEDNSRQPAKPSGLCTPVSPILPSESNRGFSTNGSVSEKDAPARKDNWKEKATELRDITPPNYNGDVYMENADAENAALTQATDPEQSIPIYGRCLCGSAAIPYPKRPVVYCQSMDCVRQTFHIDCVVEQWNPAVKPSLKDRDWYCLDCVNDSDIVTGDKRWYG